MWTGTWTTCVLLFVIDGAFGSNITSYPKLPEQGMWIWFDMV